MWRGRRTSRTCTRTSNHPGWAFSYPLLVCCAFGAACGRGGGAAPVGATLAPASASPVAQFGGGSASGPIPTTDASCPVSPQASISTPHRVDLGSTQYELPNYGFGAGPVYLSGQGLWFSGEAGVILVAPAYSQPLNLQFEQFHGSTTGTLNTASLITDPRSGWRFLDDTITAGAGCWDLRATGPGLDERIVFYVNGGTPLPG